MSIISKCLSRQSASTEAHDDLLGFKMRSYFDLSRSSYICLDRHDERNMMGFELFLLRSSF